MFSRSIALRKCGVSVYQSTTRMATTAVSRALIAGSERDNCLKEASSSGWQVVNGRDAISKRFKFVNFEEAWEFMDTVAVYADSVDHHPEWYNAYNIVDITLSTHDAGGLSLMDFALAKHADKNYIYNKNH